MFDFRRSKSDSCFRRSDYHDYNPLDSLNVLETEVIEDHHPLDKALDSYYGKSYFKDNSQDAKAQKFPKAYVYQPSTAEGQKS